ncbi:hypothetical protein AAIB33_00890 [Microbacterium sp. AZCO]|uniref:hypothetical protein n=1 Tax=Microbacterium sp. AZCO TaxID=3142976 RepID=UPI0031F3854B
MHVDRILAEAAPLRRRRRAVRWSAAITVTALLLGGGSAAMAGYGVQTPWGWLADTLSYTEREDGSLCYQGLRIETDGTVPDDAPEVLDAQEILHSIDVNDLDPAEVDAAVADLRVQLDGMRTIDTDQLVTEGWSEADWRLNAVFDIVSKRLYAELENHGYSMEDGSPISLAGQMRPCAL